jgi:deazaflavin-dependent oxidoreductase (nitroreductase family)
MHHQRVGLAATRARAEAKTRRGEESKEGMTDFNTGIIEEFRSNEGKVGGRFEDSSLILLHHLGATSGSERVTPVGCFSRPDGRIVIVASNGGAPNNPDWYYNLKAHPQIEVELGSERFVAIVEELIGREREEAWADAVHNAPELAEYGRNTSRSIPVLLVVRQA